MKSLKAENVVVVDDERSFGCRWQRVADVAVAAEEQALLPVTASRSSWTVRWFLLTTRCRCCCSEQIVAAEASC